MVTVNPMINELMTLLSQKRAELHEQEMRMEEELKKYRDDIQAIERTIELYQNGKFLKGEAMASSKKPIVMASELRGKTQMEALNYIADKNAGRIKTSVAKRLLIEAGLAKGNPRHVLPQIYHLLENSGAYERVAPGEFIRTHARLFQ